MITPSFLLSNPDRNGGRRHPGASPFYKDIGLADNSTSNVQQPFFSEDSLTMITCHFETMCQVPFLDEVPIGTQ